LRRAFPGRLVAPRAPTGRFRQWAIIAEQARLPEVLAGLEELAVEFDAAAAAAEEAERTALRTRPDEKQASG